MNTPGVLEEASSTITIANATSVEKRKRSDPVAVSAHELRYSEVSQVKVYYRGTQRTTKTSNFFTNLPRKFLRFQ